MNGTYEGAENPVKRGPKPYFTGSRQKLLEEHLEEYASLKHKNRNQFWFEFFAKWWEKFPWKLDDKDEPPLDDPAEMDKLGSVGAGERGRKSEVEVAVTLVSISFVAGMKTILPPE